MYTAYVTMVSTEYTKNGESLNVANLNDRMWYSLDNQVIKYSFELTAERVELKAKTVKELEALIWQEMTRINQDIESMDQTFRRYTAEYTRTK